MHHGSMLIVLIPYPAPLHFRSLPTHPDLSSDACTLLNRSRETIVLDLFIALKMQDESMTSGQMSMSSTRPARGLPRPLRPHATPRASRGSPLRLLRPHASRPHCIQRHVRSEARRRRRSFASDDRRCRTDQGRKTRGGGKAPRQEAQGVFGREEMMYFFLFLCEVRAILLTVHFICCTLFSPLYYLLMSATNVSMFWLYSIKDRMSLDHTK